MIRDVQVHPTEKSERVVVDEVFSDGKARILRAPRRPDAAPDDLGISTWGDEREEFISVWRMEAFVGFRKGESLREGDVFLVADGEKLTSDYEPIARDLAKAEHLIADVQATTQEARKESKYQTYLLSAIKIAADNKRELETLTRKVEQKFSEEL